MKIIRKTISALLLAGIGITSIQAQNNSPQAWTLRQCIDYAIEHNIEIRQSANSVEANKVSVNTSKWTRLPNLSVTRTQIFEAVWNMESESCQSSVANVIYNLRKKIEPDSRKPIYIKTVLGIGYITSNGYKNC